MINPYELKQAEVDFLRLLCTEKTYREIAVAMGKSSRTIDGYRDQLFLTLQVRSRTGLVLYAIHSGIFQLREVQPFEEKLE